VLGRPATPVEKAHEIPASDRILDDATSLLAALRVGRTNCQFVQQLPALLHAAKLLKKNVPQAEAVKKFLEASRSEALAMLIEAWKSSSTFDELRLLPGLVCEGEWTNDPLATRSTILNFLQAIPANQWWSLPAFLRDLKLKHPDFQRPAGDYDSWFIKRAADGQYLRGFAYWDAVDGALVRFVIEIKRWLGLADLAAPEEGKEFTAFRLAQAGTHVDRYTGTQENGKIAISSSGKISVARLAPRAVRYQVARFCEWDEPRPEEYIYHVSSRSLKHAHEQGLTAGQLLSLLAKHTKGNVPPALVKSLKRWEANGSEARAESQIVLRVSRPEVMEELRGSKAARFLGEPLGPTAVIVKPGALSKVEAALAEMGVLLETNPE
ncbi:MAG: helicase-associated domain-containing protein, partial [Chloroflexota bacterium]